MYLLAAKASVGFVMFLSLLGVVQTESITEPILMFMTIGLVPGTPIMLPPEMVLLGVAAVLMAITVLFFRSYVRYRLVVDLAMAEYVRRREDPDYRTLIPGLGRLITTGKTAVSAVNIASLEFYFWVRALGRPVIGQAVTARREFTTALVRFDRWADARLRPQETLDYLGMVARDWADRVRAYLSRLSER